MKKQCSILLAVVFILSITVTAVAAPANPFDVPAKHWAYEAVNKLVKAGIIDGYPDGSFRGDQTMNRYEMAQIVAKAMANASKADADTKAIIDKMAVEFQSELRALGARVDKLETKVNKLEANASKIKFGGDFRLRYIAAENAATNPVFSTRLRVAATANVSDNVSVFFRDVFTNYNEFGKYTTGDAVTGGDDRSRIHILSDFNVTAKNLLPGVNVTAGRYSPWIGQTGYPIGSQGGFDGIEATWKSGKGSLKAAYADATAVNLNNFGYGGSALTNVANMYYSEYSYAFDSTLKANVFKLKGLTDNGKSSTFAAGDTVLDTMGVGVSWKMSKDWTISGDYWQNDSEAAKAANNGSASTAYVARLAYKGNKISVPGSWGAFVEYNKISPYTFDQNWTGNLLTAMPYNDVLNATFWDVQYSRTLDKNITFDLIYAFNVKNPKTGTDGLNRTGPLGSTFTRAHLNFMF